MESRSLAQPMSNVDLSSRSQLLRQLPIDIADRLRGHTR